jgi:hypothetical protein
VSELSLSESEEKAQEKKLAKKSPPSIIKEEAPPPGVFAAWCWTCQRRDFQYIPQLGDRVVYFKVGHFEALQGRASAFPPPFVLIPRIPELAIAVVIGVQFVISYLILTLKFEGDWITRVEYQLPATPCWLVEERVFELSMSYASDLRPGADVAAVFMYGDRFVETSGVVEWIRHDWQNRPYHALGVKWQRDMEASRTCPWKLVIPPQPKPASRFAEFCKLFVEEIKMFLGVPEFRRFAYLRENLEVLARNSLKPMDLTLLITRLANDWYQSLEELMADIQCLRANAVCLGCEPRTMWNMTTAMFQRVRIVGERCGMVLTQGIA